MTASTLSPEAATEAIKVKEEIYLNLKNWFEKVQQYSQQHKEVYDLMWGHIKVICKASIEEIGNLMKVLRARNEIEKKHSEAAI